MNDTIDTNDLSCPEPETPVFGGMIFGNPLGLRPGSLTFKAVEDGWQVVDRRTGKAAKAAFTNDRGDELPAGRYHYLRKAVLCQEVRRRYPGESEDADVADERLGWGYKLTDDPDAPWGRVSSDFSQVLYPRYACATFTEGREMWGSGRRLMLFPWWGSGKSRGLTAPPMLEEASENRAVPGRIHSMVGYTGGFPSWPNFWPESVWYAEPDETFFHEYPDLVYEEGEQPGEFLFRAGRYDTAALMLSGVGPDGLSPQIWSIVHGPGFYEMRCGHTVRYHFETPMMFRYLRELAEAPGYDKIISMDTDLWCYAVQREGWWALFLRYGDVWFQDAVEQSTPFALTGFDDVAFVGRAYHEDNYGSYCVVDRFGLKGLYCLNTGGYLLPCVYDEIFWDGDAFALRRGGQRARWQTWEAPTL